MNLLLIIMNSYVGVWSYIDKYDFAYKRISDLEHPLTFFINIFSSGVCLENLILNENFEKNRRTIKIMTINYNSR